MRRPAAAADLPRLLAIRDAAGDDALSDPALLTEDGLRRLAGEGAAIVWDEAGEIAGFAAVDRDRVHLLVDPARRDRGIGRDLLAWACGAVRDGGHGIATVALAPNGSAERHYRAAGWEAAGCSATGGLILRKPSGPPVERPS